MWKVHLVLSVVLPVAAASSIKVERRPLCTDCTFVSADGEGDVTLVSVRSPADCGDVYARLAKGGAFPITQFDWTRLD